MRGEQLPGRVEVWITTTAKTPIRGAGPEHVPVHRESVLHSRAEGFLVTNVDREIQDRIRRFADDITRLVRHDAVQAIAVALGGVAAPARRRTKPSPGRAAGGQLPAGGSRRSARVSKGSRRTSVQLRKAAEALLDHVTAHPGQRMEEISEILRMSAGELRRPLTKLLAKGLLVREGQKRGSRYYAPDATPRRTGRGSRRRRG